MSVNPDSQVKAGNQQFSAFEDGDLRLIWHSFYFLESALNKMGLNNLSVTIHTEPELLHLNIHSPDSTKYVSMRTIHLNVGGISQIRITDD